MEKRNTKPLILNKESGGSCGDICVRRECPQDGGVEDVDVAQQLIKMNLPRRLAKREAIHRQ